MERFLKKMKTSVKIKFYAEKEDGTIDTNPEKSEITNNNMRDIIHEDVKIINGEDQEKEEVQQRYKLYKEMWF